jgi:hypothetical protein
MALLSLPTRRPLNTTEIGVPGPARPETVSSRREVVPPLPAVLTSVAAALLATAWSAVHHSMVLYGDARAHLDVARHVTDGLQTGLAQLGSVWLPLPHILLVPLVAIGPLWHSGAAGAIVGGICFVYASLRVFSLVEELTGSRLGAWCGFAVFIVNLNMLYIQSTALTEPVLLAFMVGAVFHLARWMRTFSVRDLLWSSLLVFCATLTRYEGWALLVAGVVLVAVWARLRDRRKKSAQANLVLFAVIGSYGIGLWFLYNLIIFHDPLYFLHSAYSAQAINGAQAQFGLLGTKGNLVESTLTYGWDMIDVVGAPILIIGGVSSVMLMAIKHHDRRRTLFTLALLAAPVAFEILSLYAGQTTIRVPQVFPHGMWNDRYGVVALPFCAVAAGVLVGRWRWTTSIVIPTAAIVAAVMALGTPLTLADGRTGTSSAAAGKPETAAAYLSEHYRGGEILADDSAASSLMFASNLDLRQFVTIGFHPFWEHAIVSPAKNVAWAVSYPGDAVTADMTAHPDRFSDFRLQFTEGRIKLFERAPAVTAQPVYPGVRIASGGVSIVRMASSDTAAVIPLGPMGSSPGTASGVLSPPVRPAGVQSPVPQDRAPGPASTIHAPVHARSDARRETASVRRPAGRNPCRCRIAYHHSGSRGPRAQFRLQYAVGLAETTGDVTRR